MGKITYLAAANRLRGATTIVELDAVSHMIQYVASATDRETLAAIYKERAAELTAPKDKESRLEQ